MTTRLIIARHGNTFAPGDVIRRVGSRTDLPLVASGLEQGRKLGLYLKSHDLLPDIVWTSDLQRTKQTAQMAFDAAGITPSVRQDSLFDEIDYGPDENKPEADVAARLGEAALKAWDQDAMVPDGWRVNADNIIKGWRAFGDKIAREDQNLTVMVVTSNGVARFAPYLTGDFEGFRQKFKIKISTGAFGLFTYDDGPHWVAERWNVRPIWPGDLFDDGHLLSLGSKVSGDRVTCPPGDT